MFKDINVETERLTLRPYNIKDIDDLYKIYSDPKVMAFIPEGVMSYEWVKDLIIWMNEYCYEKNTPQNIIKFGVSVALKDTNKVIGWCGLGQLECKPVDVEIFYGLSSEYWGKGLATEAAGGMLKYAFEVIGLERVVAAINDNNNLSKRVVEKLYMKTQGKLENLSEEYSGFDGEWLYAITSEEYLDMENIFKIECEDIVLREFGVGDLDELYNLTLQPEITDFLPDWKATKEQRRDWLINFHMKKNREFLEAAPSIDEEGLILGIILKETNEFIGWCGSCIKDELPTPNREIFYAISKDYRGRGYTTQASQGLIKYLFERTNIEELNAIALLHNIPSNKVIQKCGFNHIGAIEVDNEEFNYYKLIKSV